MELEIQGLGIILYSLRAVGHIAAGADYFKAQFWEPHDVAQHVLEGQLTCFCTGSLGEYRLQFHQGIPDEQALQAAEFKIRLALQVHDGVVCIRDLYDLMDWLPACPPDQ